MHIDSYPGIDISIKGEQVLGSNVPENGPDEVTACIECQVDTKFKIKICVTDMDDFDDISFFIYFDGQPVTKICGSPQHHFGVVYAST